MEEIIIKYDSVSPRRQEINDRIQLLAASFTIILGYWGSLGIYTGIKVILPITGFAIALLNLLFVRFYKKLVQKYGFRFEVLILRINGIIMLTTGIGYYLNGSKYLHFTYYFLTICYFLILPYIIIRAKKKRMLRFSESKIITSGKIGKNMFLWQNIESIEIQGNQLTISEKNKHRKKKFYLEKDSVRQSEVYDFLLNVKSKYGFNLDIIDL